MMLLQAAIAWEIFRITSDPLQLGLIGAIRMGPSLGLSLVGGAVADSLDRRRVVIAGQVIVALAAIALALATGVGESSVYVIYAVVFVIAVANAFDFPARQALLPTLVPAVVLPNAITVTSVVQQLSFATGPALAGGVIALLSVTAAYVLFIALTVLHVVTLMFIRPLSEPPKRGVTIEAVREGVRFVWRRQALVGCMALDMFAVIFGGATILLPVYAKEVLGVGALGYGVLAASFDLGALLMAGVLVWLPPVQRTGKVMIVAVALYGVATIVFGFSRIFALSLFAYGMAGVADQISVVMRQTTIQMATPDDLRGRVSSVNWLFISTSNQLGTFESGLVAALTSPTFAVVSGGVGCLVVLAIVAAALPELRGYRIPRPGVQPAHPLEPAPAAPT